MSNSTEPLVTCWMATRNRRAWLPEAIRCWQLQTYANKELLIVADGEKVNDLIPRDDPRVSLVTLLDEERPLFLPDKFNFVCRMAKGVILSKFDDDDWSAPQRLTEQVALLQSTGKAVTGYHSILFTDGRDWYRFCHESWTAGTSLTFLKSWWEANPFKPDIIRGIPQQVASDGIFARNALAKDELVTVEGRETMVASIHDRNTCVRQVQGSCWVKLHGFRGVPGYRWPLHRQHHHHQEE